MDQLGALYHWSPKECREDIMREGLKVYSKATTHSDGYRAPYLCFGPTPSIAWALSGDIDLYEDVGEWDLWMYRVRPEDSVRVRPNRGGAIEEVKIENSVPASDLWYVATRSGSPEMLPPKPKRKRKARKKK